MIFLIDRIDEKRPTVLQVRDHHHADDAEDELAPARRIRRACRCGRIQLLLPLHPSQVSMFLMSCSEVGAVTSLGPINLFTDILQMNSRTM